MSRDSLAIWFDKLSLFLIQNQPLWSENPYFMEHLSWESIDPESWAWAEGLDESQIDEHEHSPEREPTFPNASQKRLALIKDLTDFPKGFETVDLSPELRWRLPRRKAAQIEPFLGSLKPYLKADLVDWCSGKGHVGRAASAISKQRLTQVEIRPDLCQVSRHLNQKLQLVSQVHCIDVLKEEINWPSDPMILAMHACGDLGVAAIKLHSRIGGAIALAPCCHHKIESKTYQPMSRQGREYDLELSRSDLHFSVAFETRASHKLRRLRRQGMVYRCALSAAQNRWHVASKPCPRSWLSLPFADFAHKMAQRDSFTLPDDLESLVEIGTKRALRIRARAMLRAPFRRAIEAWLALDKALYLQSLGKRVDVIQFCEFSATPRNLLLLAR